MQEAVGEGVVPFPLGVDIVLGVPGVVTVLGDLRCRAVRVRVLVGADRPEGVAVLVGMVLGVLAGVVLVGLVGMVARTTAIPRRRHHHQAHMVIMAVIRGNAALIGEGAWGVPSWQLSCLLSS